MNNIKEESNVLPDTYIPKSLRREVSYAIGIEHKPNQFGMFYGPLPTIEEVLDYDPTIEAMEAKTDPVRNPKIFIIRFNADGTDEKMYRWGTLIMRWVKCDKE